MQSQLEGAEQLGTDLLEQQVKLCGANNEETEWTRSMLIHALILQSNLDAAEVR